MFSIVVINSFVVFAFTFILFYNYVSNRISRFVQLVLFSAWYMIFMCIAILPLDIYATITKIESDNQLTEYSYYIHAFWRFCYWYLFVVAFFCLPMFQEYYIAGDFTFDKKIQRALKRNLTFYSLLGTIGLIFSIYLYIIESLTIYGIKALMMALANAWGTFLIIFLMGYGLIEVPRYILNLTNYKDRIQYLEWKAKVNTNFIEERADELEKCIEELNNLNSSPLIPSNKQEEQRNLIQAIENEQEEQTLKAAEMSDEELDKWLLGYTTKFNYNQLVDLSYAIKYNRNEINKQNNEISNIYSEWYKLNVLFGDVEENNSENLKSKQPSEYIQLEERRDTLTYKMSEIGIMGLPTRKSFNRPNANVSHYSNNAISNDISEIDDQRRNSLNSVFAKSETKEESALSEIMILFNRYFYQIFFRTMAYKLIVMSIFIILSEMNVFYEKKYITLTNEFLKNQSLVTVTIICLIPTAFMFGTCVFGLFHMEIHKYYGIYGSNNTDPYSLIFLTSFMGRVIFPLCLNSLQILNIHDTSLQDTMNISIVIPILGNSFSRFFPTILFFLCFLHFFDFAGKALNGLGLNYILYGMHRNELNKVKEGRSILLELKEDLGNEHKESDYF